MPNRTPASPKKTPAAAGALEVLAALGHPSAFHQTCGIPHADPQVLAFLTSPDIPDEVKETFLVNWNDHYQLAAVQELNMRDIQADDKRVDVWIKVTLHEAYLAQKKQDLQIAANKHRQDQESAEERHQQDTKDRESQRRINEKKAASDRLVLVFKFVVWPLLIFFSSLTAQCLYYGHRGKQPPSHTRDEQAPPKLLKYPVGGVKSSSYSGKPHPNLNHPGKAIELHPE